MGTTIVMTDGVGATTWWQDLCVLLLHFIICHSKKCHRPRTLSCHKVERGGTLCTQKAFMLGELTGVVDLREMGGKRYALGSMHKGCAGEGKAAG